MLLKIALRDLAYLGRSNLEASLSSKTVRKFTCQESM